MLRKVFISLLVIGIAVFSNSRIFAGKLYIKADLELKRAARLVEMADSDYRNAKIHMLLSPDIASREFAQAHDKYKQAVEIIEVYGAGYYTPGDIEDLTQRKQECIQWIDECKKKLKAS